MQKKKQEKDEDKKEFEIEEILDLIKDSKNKIKQVLIKWKGYSTLESTFEPIENIKNKKLIKQFTSNNEKIVNDFKEKNRIKKINPKNFKREKILDDRNNESEFLVNWNNFPLTSWEPEKKIPFKKIKEYKNSEQKKKNDEEKKKLKNIDLSEHEDLELKEKEEKKKLKNEEKEKKKQEDEKKKQEKKLIRLIFFF
jgi:hydrocephalus-inducing protein